MYWQTVGLLTFFFFTITSSSSPLFFCFLFPLGAGHSFVLRADINECERLPQPCAHQCINTPGSYTCTCPPGRHLLGDGKSCAGLERLPGYQSYSYIHRTSQSSPEGSSSPRLYHNVASQSFHSYTANSDRGFRRRSQREAPKLQVTPVCQRGFKSRGGLCLGNYRAQAAGK